MPFLSKLTGLINTSAILRQCIEFRKLYLGITCILLLTFLCLGGCTSPSDSIPRATITDTAADAFKSPEIIVLKMDKMTLDSNSLNLTIQAKILNPNAGSIVLDDFKVLARDSMGQNKFRETVSGGSIDPTSVRIFNLGVALPSELLEEKQLTIYINSQTVNTNAALPVSSTLEVNIPDILSKLIADPKIVAHASITKLLRNGLNNQLEAQVEGSIDNPNPIGLNFGVIRISIKDKKGAVIATDNLTSVLMTPNSEYPFQRTIILPIQVMNETGMTVDIETTAQAPNYVKLFKGTEAIRIPKLKELISVPQITFDTNVTCTKWIYTVSPSFLKMTIAALIKNDNNFDLTTGDLQINIYKPKDTLINSTLMTSNIIQGIQSSSTKTLTNWIDFQSDIVGTARDYAYITLDIGVGLQGVDEKCQLSANTVLELRPQGWPEQ